MKVNKLYFKTDQLHSKVLRLFHGYKKWSNYAQKNILFSMNKVKKETYFAFDLASLFALDSCK